MGRKIETTMTADVDALVTDFSECLVKDKVTDISTYPTTGLQNYKMMVSSTCRASRRSLIYRTCSRRQWAQG